MKILISHPTGNANSRATVKAFFDKGLLHSFFTSIAVFKGTLSYKIVNKFNFLREFKKREFNSCLIKNTRVYPLKELGRIVSIKLKISKLIVHEKGSLCTDKVYRYLDKKVSNVLRKTKAGQLDVVYAYEDGALESFRVAKKLNVKRYYDLPIGYWKSARKLLREEEEKNPEWWPTMTGFLDSQQKLENKDEEIRLASHIFVASSFTAKTLGEYTGVLPKVTVIPYGFPEVVKNREYNKDEKKPLKLLFVGGLSQRKGISYLFEAVEMLKEKVELTVIGKKAVDNCDILNDTLKKHNWISSLPHSEVLDLMKTQDILIFPSLFEGFGLVVTEAMSQGTPVITTERTCGPDFIKDGENGWLIEAGTTDSLFLKLSSIIENRSVVEKVGRKALETACNRPWSNYGADLVNFIEEI